MKPARAAPLAALCLLCLGGLTTSCDGCDGETSGAVEPMTGEQLVETRCGPCHSMTRIRRERLDAAQWGTVIDDMVRRGAELDDDERRQVIEYLTTMDTGQ